MADIKQIKLPDGSVLNLKDSAARDQMEIKSNKVTALNSASTDSEYPSAKAVYDLVSSISVPVVDVQNEEGTSLVSGGIATIPNEIVRINLGNIGSANNKIPFETFMPFSFDSDIITQIYNAVSAGKEVYLEASVYVQGYNTVLDIAVPYQRMIMYDWPAFCSYGAINDYSESSGFKLIMTGIVLGAIDYDNDIVPALLIYLQAFPSDYHISAIANDEITTILSSRTINNHSLNSSFNLTYSDVGAASSSHTHTAAEVGALSSNTVYVSTVNGQSGAITIEEPLVIEGTLTFTLSSTSGSGTFTPTSGDVTKIPTANEVYIKADIHGFSMLSSDYVWLRKMRKAATGMGIVMFNGVFDTASGTVYIEVEGEPDDEGDWHYAIWSVTYRILQQKLTSYVSSVNGASGQVTLTAANVGAVPTSRTVNGKALSSNITLNAADVGALSSTTAIPSDTNDLTNGAGYITSYTETDPTVPSWAKASSKPTYTYDEVGAPSADQLTIDMGDNQPHKIVKWEHFSYDDPEISGYYMYVDSTANEWYIPDGEFIGKQSEKLVSQVMAAIPTAVSQLDNDAGYITSAPTAVSQLTNDLHFATTSQVSTAITSAIGEINEFDVEVAAALPTQNIKDHTIYFVAKESLENDIYDEFMYINNAWEHIGSTEVDLSNYVTKTDNAYRAQSIFYGEVDSTSTSTNFTATISGLTELRDGVCILLKNGVVTSASGFTININGLGPKPSYSNMATGNDITPTAPTRDTTIFNINYTMLFIYSSDIVSGGGWIMYRGYDANSNTLGYQLRTNSSVRTATDSVGRYRLLFTSASDSQWVPTTNSTSTNSTAARTVNQRPIDPFGDIVYYGSTTILAPNDSVSATIQWQQYTLNIGYSFNRTGKAQAMTHPAPVYVKCAPQSDGSAIIDADTPYVQALPSSADGKIYIYLGDAYSATNVELRMNHPVYYYTDGGIRLWSGVNAASKSYVDTVISSIAIPSKVSELTNDAGYISSYTETDPTVPSWAKAASKPTYTAAEVGALPSNTTYVSTVNGQSGAVTVDTPLVLRGSMSVTLSATHGTGTFTLSSGDPNDIPNHDTVYIISSSNLSTDDIVLQKNRYSSYYYAYFTTTFRTTLGTVYVEIEGTPDDEYDWDYATWNVRYWVLQDKLTFDSTPTENSTNPVTSGGVYAALQSSGGSDEIYELTATLTATMNILAGGVTFGTFTLVSGDITQVHNYKQAVLKITILKEGDTSVEYGTINAVMTQDFNPARSLTGNCICGLAFVGLCQWYEFLEYMRPRVVTVTYDEQSLTPSLRWHVHDTQMNDDYGNLNYVGWVTGTATAIESGDALLVADSNNHNMLVKSTTTFDGATTTKALTQAGTFVDFPVVSVNGQSGAVTIPDASAYILTYGGTVTFFEVLAAYNANRPIYVKYTDPEEGDLFYSPVAFLVNETNYYGLDCVHNTRLWEQSGTYTVGDYGTIQWNSTTGWRMDSVSVQIPTTYVRDVRDNSGTSIVSNGIATLPAYATESYVNTAISSAGFVEDFPITITQSNDTYTADKTVAEIAAAVEAGKNVYVIFYGIIYPLIRGDAVAANQYKQYLFGCTYSEQGYISSTLFNISNDGTSDSITYEDAFNNLGALFIPYGTTPDFDISDAAGTVPIYCEYTDTDLGHLYLPLINDSSPYEFGKTLIYSNGHASYYSVTAYYSGNNFVWNEPSVTDLEGSSYTETDPTVPSWAKAASKPTYTASEVGALASSGDTTYSGADNVLCLQGPAGSNSPILRFQRGTLTDNYNDWQIQDRGGYLYFDERGSGSSSWTNRVMFNTTGGVVATSFSGSGANLTGIVKSVNGNTGAITGIQTTANLVTALSSSVTDTQYPSAKLLYDTVGDIETLLGAI